MQTEYEIITTIKFELLLFPVVSSASFGKFSIVNHGIRICEWHDVNAFIRNNRDLSIDRERETNHTLENVSMLDVLPAHDR